MNGDFEKYEVIEGVGVGGGKERKEWWGGMNGGVRLVWKVL